VSSSKINQDSSGFVEKKGAEVYRAFWTSFGFYCKS
jgi:hypothetical protein